MSAAHVNGRIEGFRTHPPAQVCILRLSAIGDICHALPVVRTLQRAWPQTSLTWVIGKAEASLMSGIDGVELVKLDKSAGAGGFLDVRRRLTGRRFDLLLMMHASMRANLLSLAIRADVRLGFDRARARDCQWLFSNARITARSHEHVMDGLFGFAEALGIRERTLRWDIPVSDGDRAFAERCIPSGQRTLIISPCSSHPRRNWRPEYYAHVADHAVRVHGMRVVLAGGRSPVEQAMGQAIEHAARETLVNLIGRDTLPQLLALLGRATVLLSPDAGPAHMATVVGTPVIGLYAATNPKRSGPYLSRSWCVDRFEEAARKFLGRPASAVAWGTKIERPGVMNLIEPLDVTQKLDQLMQQRALQTNKGVRP